MKQTPILFQTEMIRAALEGRKTHTRRIMKNQPDKFWVPYSYGDIHKMIDGDFVMTRTGNPVVIGWGPCNADGDCGYCCPYGKPGDLLWARETMRVIAVRDRREYFCSIRVKYEADGAESGWIKYPERLKGIPVVGKCLSYGGYREASRLTLKITDIRVERVQEISEQDAIAEGVTDPSAGTEYEAPIGAHYKSDARTWYAMLWSRINGLESWKQNPWVWVITFEVIKQNIDEYLKDAGLR